MLWEGLFLPKMRLYVNTYQVGVKGKEINGNTVGCLFFSFFWSGLQGPNAYSLWYGVVPKPSIGEGYL